MFKSLRKDTYQSRGQSLWLLACERDARAPSKRRAGNAGVPPAIFV